MKQFSIPHGFFLSFFSADFYRDVARRWRGVGMLYLLVIVMVAALSVYVQAKMGMDAFMEAEGRGIVAQLPEITVTGGRARINQPEPYRIYDSQRNVVAVIDTTGSLTTPDEAGAHALMTADSLIVKKSDLETRTYHLNEWEDTTITAETAMEFAELVQSMVTMFLYPVLVVFLSLWGVVRALFYALVAQIPNAIFKAGLGFGDCMRLAVVAMTPMTVADALLMQAMGAGASWYVSLLVTLGYLCFAVRSAGQKQGGNQ